MALESKEKIKRKMIRNASKIWGYPEAQDINSFDPMVGMLIGALADELYKIANEIEKSDTRIIEKLINLLFNNENFSIFPAHALATVKPAQDHFEIGDSYQLYCDKRIQIDTTDVPTFESKRIYFTPTGSFTLFNGCVKYIGSGNSLCEITDNNIKNTYCKTLPGKVLDTSKFYIGIELSEDIENIDGLSLYFNTKDKQQEDWLFNSLPSSSWKINGHPVVFKQGFRSKETDGKITFEELFKNENDVSSKTLNHIENFYQNKFLVLDGNGHHLKNFHKDFNIQDEFQEAFSTEEIDNLTGNLLWIEVQFPIHVKLDVLKEISCAINCMPVVNRKINEFTHTLHSGSNIIPLSSEEFFFDIKQIVDSRGTEYTPISLIDSEKAENNSYFVRQGGVARFDSRDVTEILNDLMGLIREESAAFSIFGTEMIASEIKQLDQTIARLKQRVELANSINNPHSYAVLKSSNEYERAYIQFWSSNGEIANNIHANYKLISESGSDLIPESMMFLTPTYGGKEKLTKENKLDFLRKSILSKGRIVTNEDIRALCFEHFGDILQKVNIKKGSCLASGTRQGYLNTIDVYLIFNKRLKLSDEELNFMKEDLKIKIQNNSADHLAFRIIS